MVGTGGGAHVMRSEIVRLKAGRVVTLRPAVVEDAARLQENINSVGAEIDYILVETVGDNLDAEREWIREFDGVSSMLLVAEDGGKIVGQADVHVGRSPKETHVGTIGIAIREGYRNLGLGRAMIERLFEWMLDRRLEKACLQVFSTNTRAIALYRRLGFEIEGVRKGQYRIRGELVDDIMMGKWLA